MTGAKMRALGLFVLMLVTYWVVMTWTLAHSAYWSWQSVQVALVFALALGTIYAVPAITYLFAADAVSAMLRFPWSALAYLGFVAFGCVLFAAVFYYVIDQPLPTTRQEWLEYRERFYPFLASASVLLAKQVVGAFGRAHTAAR